MIEPRRLILELRAVIPVGVCRVRCHHCCGPTHWSRTEVAMLREALGLPGPPDTLPRLPRAVGDPAPTREDCPFLRAAGCAVYEHRPLVCRLFGVSHDPGLRCPHGQRCEDPLTAEYTRDLWGHYVRECGPFVVAASEAFEAEVEQQRRWLTTH